MEKERAIELAKELETLADSIANIRHELYYDEDARKGRSPTIRFWHAIAVGKLDCSRDACQGAGIALEVGYGFKITREVKRDELGKPIV